MTKYHFVRESANSKIGPIFATTTSADTCPDACPFKRTAEGVKGCYADGGPLGMHWKAVSAGKRGGDLATLCENVAALPEGALWRHNQAGDLPGINGEIDAAALEALTAANAGKRGFTYTHKPMTAGNAEAVRAANAAGFTVNLSGNSLAHADALADLGIAPVATVVPTGTPVAFKTPAGKRGVMCPAQVRDDVSCAGGNGMKPCGAGKPLCQRADREVIVGFWPHGASHKRADAVTRA